MTFFRSHLPHKFPYSINGYVLVFVRNDVRDLCFVFVPSVSPIPYIDYITCKTIKLLDFIKHITSDFNLMKSLKVLGPFTVSLVRPIFE